ncbi:MAG: hypothetical protein IPN01_15930 [Deltaproteobacteria bacterium]|nr:hypothetical protein [Deltaproteobacteria bacterium]
MVFTQAEIEQLRVLRERDGETSLASMPLDLAKIVLPALRSRGIDPSSRAALDEVDRILASLGAPVQRGNQGLDVTQFTQDAALHETLEARVGQELALAPMNLQDVQAALAQGHPVPVLTAAESLMGDRRVADAHAQVILSFDGERYTVHDPQGGGVRQLTAAELQQALGARWALLPTGAAVSPQATTSGGVTSPAPLGGDDPQRRLDAAQAVKTVMNDATVASLAAEMGAGDQRGDAPLNRLRAAIDARLAELRAQAQAAGEDTSWLTTEFVLDLISQDVALRRVLQRGLVGTDANRAEVLAAIEPAHRLAETMNAASTDKARLAAVAEAVSRVGGELRLLESGVSGHELIGALARFESDEDRMVAQEMLQTGKVLTWLGSGANRALMVESRALDGARAPLTERVSLLTELGVLANSVDPKRPEEAKERLEGVRARVTQTLGRLRALRAERQDMSLPAAQRDAAKAELLALEAEIKAIARGPLRSGGVLAALSAHDPSWTTDSLVPLLTEAQGGPVALSPDLAARQAALPLWRDHANDLAALKSMSVNKRKAFFERIIRDAQRHGGDPKQQLAEVARRYAEEHGSLSVVIRDTFARQGQDLSGRSPVRDMGGLRATLDAFGFESSAVMDTVDPVTGGSDHAQRAQVIEAVHDASTAILNGMNKLLIGDRAGHVDRALRRLTERLEAVYGASLADPTTRAALARQSVGVALGETHGDLMGLVAQSSMATQDPNMFDAVVRALGIDPAQLGALVEEAKALKGGEETLDAHMAQNPTLQSSRLPSADRVALVEATKALPELLDTLLRMPPDQRALVRADPLLMATLARSQPEAWPFLKTVLNDTLSPVAMLQVMELLRYSVASGVDVKDLGLAAMKLGKDVLLSQGASLIKDSFSTLVDLGDTVITSVGGDLLKARTQRMQEDMTELLKDYVAWRDQQLRAQGTAAPPDEARALEAQSLLADPEFTRFLNESFSPEQRAAILSTLMHGEVDTSDTIRLERLNPLTQEARVLDPLREAWDDKEGEEGEKIGELRADPGALGRLSRVGEGRRAQALGMLLNTPLGKVLAEARARVDISGKNQWRIVNELAALSQADRDALRDDPATVETLASLITDGEALRSLQALLQVDENNLGDEIYAPGSSAQDKERAWLRTSSVAGLTAMMKHGDERLLLGLAAKIYRAQVIDPSQTPGFADRVTSGVRAGDLSAQDRGAIADALRATEDYQRLLKARPEVAAAVIDAVLGEVDPSAMLYDRNVKREFLDASADDLVDIVQDMSVETFLTTMVNMDGFGVAIHALQSARQAQAGLPPSATADERTLAADAVRAAERAAREYAFDVRPERVAELKDLNNEDKEKVLQAARKRVELLLSGQQEGAMGEIARGLQSSMTQAGATAGVTLGEDEVKALFDRERGARNELLQAEQRLTEDKRVVQVLERVVGRLKIPGFDMKGELAEAEQSVAAWRAALTGFDGAGGPSQGDLETLQSLRAKAEAARAALLETHKKALETAQEQLKPLIKGAVGLLPGPLELAEPALEALATEYAGRVLKGESLTRKADLSRVVREHIKSQLGDQVDGLLKDTKILEGLDGLIDKLVGANLPLLEGVFEEVIDEKLKGKLDGLKDKLPDMDDKVAEMGEDRLNDGLRRVGAKGGGEDRYTSSIQREQEHAAMFTTVSNALDERAAAMGAQVSASEVGQVQSALRAALGAGDVAALRSLTAALGVDVMSQLLFHPARPEDDVLRDETLARLSPAVRDPIVAWRDALRSGGPGAVGGLSEDPLQRAADDADQALQAALGDPDAPHRPHRGGSAEWCYARLQRLWRARLVSLGLAEEELPKAEAVRAGLEEAILTGRPARLRAAMRDAGPTLARRLAGEVLAGTPVPKEHSAAIQAAVEDGSRGVAR